MIEQMNGEHPSQPQQVDLAAFIQQAQARNLKAGEKLAKSNTTFCKVKTQWWRTYTVLTWILCGVAVAGGLRLLGIYVR